ncbi:hypothetical protein OCU04_005829 [Sclerotinia nivalis]|uniref:Uncharacterized protein n=1 Tax=Sclerotinia nivalis TaxID=352851 RepID=A0A9X0DIT2_9HELO|nr:hypothetical protein OCU04_005829 [Sclerotinia nivalis]
MAQEITTLPSLRSLDISTNKPIMAQEITTLPTLRSLGFFYYDPEGLFAGLIPIRPYVPAHGLHGLNLLAPPAAPAPPVAPAPPAAPAPRAAAAPPAEEQPLSSWENNPKPPTREDPRLEIWPSTSIKDPATHYVQGKFCLPAGDATTIGSMAWIRAAAPHTREEALVVAVVQILGRNGATHLRVLIDAITKFWGVYHTEFGSLVGSEAYEEKWRIVNSTLRTTLSRKDYKRLFCGVGKGTWRLRRPEDVHQDEDEAEAGPSGGQKAASKKRKTGPAGQGPAAKKSKGGSVGGRTPDPGKGEGAGRPSPTT